MRILYLGLPLGALWLMRHGHVPTVIALGHPEAPGARRLRRSVPPSCLVLGKPRLDDASIEATLRSAAPDVLLSFFWPKRIPASTLALPPRGCFGTHPSLLPRHRGPDPYFWAIRDGDAETGVTLHRLDADYDTGAIVGRRRIAITPRHDSWTLARALDRPALALLVEAADRLARGEPLEGIAQDDALATHAPVPDDEDCSIDWTDDADSIVRLVRAASPTPGALADIEGETFEIVRAEPFTGTVPRALEVREAFVDSSSVVVRAARGAVRILAARDANGDPVDLVGVVSRAREERSGNQAS